VGKKVSVRRVRQLAEKQGLVAISDLADAAGLAHNTARRWWNDDLLLTRFEEDVIVALCQALQVEPGHLFELVNSDDLSP